MVIPLTTDIKPVLLGKRAQGLEERRRRLVKAASDLIAERDNGQFSMSELAERAGLSLATPYNLFGSKAAVLAKVFERLVLGFQRDAAWMDGIPAADQVLGVIDRLAVAFAEHGRLFRNLWRALYGLDMSEHQNWNQSMSIEIVRPLVESLTRGGHLPSDVPKAVIETALIRIFDSNFELWASQDWDALDLRRHLRQGFALIFLGLFDEAAHSAMRLALTDAE